MIALRIILVAVLLGGCCSYIEYERGDGDNRIERKEKKMDRETSGVHEWDGKPDPETGDQIGEFMDEWRERVGLEGSELIDKLDFGLQVQAFVNKSEIGQYLVARATEMLVDNTAALVKLDGLQGVHAEELHFKARVGHEVLTWLGEAIEEGLTARAALEGER